MSINNDSKKQSSPTDQQLHQVYYFLMERVMRQARLISKEAFREHGIDITVDQWILLKRIAETAGMNQRELSEATFKEPASVVRILDILVKKEYVQRLEVVEDRRQYLVALTEKGQELYQHALPIVVELRQKGIEGIPLESLEELKKNLRVMYENLCR